MIITKNVLSLNVYKDMVLLNEREAKVIMSSKAIAVGCTTAAPEVLQWLLDTHKKMFSKDSEITVQYGQDYKDVIATMGAAAPASCPMGKI